jgi:hypothetical protein
MELIQGQTAPMPTGPVPPDIVVVATKHRHDIRNVTSMLWRWPHSQVLMITVDGHQAAMYELEPQRTELGELSPAELVDSIRVAVRRRRDTPPAAVRDS